MDLNVLVSASFFLLSYDLFLIYLLPLPFHFLLSARVLSLLSAWPILFSLRSIHLFLFTSHHGLSLFLYCADLPCHLPFNSHPALLFSLHLSLWSLSCLLN